MKFRIHPGANHYGESAFDFVDEWHRRELEIIVQRNLGETRGNAVALLNAQGQGTLSRSHYVDPDFYQLVCNEQIPDVAYLNAASISVPKREIQEAGRIVFAKEQKGKLSDREKLEIEGRARKKCCRTHQSARSKRCHIWTKHNGSHWADVLSRRRKGRSNSRV